MGNLPKIRPQSESGVEDFARWLGRHDAFAAMAGGCSAAEAESLRRIRDGKLFKNAGLSWDEFCTKRLGVSRRNVERTLRLLDEFGPAYFHVAQVAHVTADQYRAIAHSVGNDGVRLDGAVVALLPENSEKVSAAVAELLRREKPPSTPPSAATVEGVLKRCQSLRESILALPGLDPTETSRVAQAIGDLTYAAITRGVPLRE